MAGIANKNVRDVNKSIQNLCKLKGNKLSSNFPKNNVNFNLREYKHYTDFNLRETHLKNKKSMPINNFDIENSDNSSLDTSGKRGRKFMKTVNLSMPYCFACDKGLLCK